MGNNLMNDVLLLNAAISIALGQVRELSGKILDTAAIWVGICSWDLDPDQYVHGRCAFEGC